ncbi:YhcN/YlaJ family sporulation lipoprotein [Desulfofalx alkaliphila]|uniref:YhcN/YlaJ family sporulation lipoprotein n=1 Tax=Desulfofalx alkaliphila TaxID=105483 RepID=UPI0004E28C91|nr:YhcN/YlaJ family sporulation lipoprotein [Desulfofalx alkaliphila]
MKLLFKILILMLTFFLLAACSMQGSQKKPLPEDLEVTFENEVSQGAMQLAMSVAGVKEATSVAINREVGTAVKVTGFDRWRLKSIREETYKKIKDAYPDYEVHVTSDKKLFWQLQQIRNEIDEGKVKSPVEVKDRFDKINENMGG